MTPALFLDLLLPPLKFNLNLSQRVLTHASHKSAITGHNARLSFIGRRVAQAYLHLFLDNSIHINNHDSSTVAARTLHPQLLGEHVASAWNIQHALQWTPAQPPSNPILIHSVGLYKVHGEAVQAILGAVFYQFGGVTAHRLFHTRILPLILLPNTKEGLPDIFHEEALRICDSLGGPDALLDTPPSEQK